MFRLTDDYREKIKKASHVPADPQTIEGKLLNHTEIHSQFIKDYMSLRRTYIMKKREHDKLYTEKWNRWRFRHTEVLTDKASDIKANSEEDVKELKFELDEIELEVKEFELFLDTFKFQPNKIKSYIEYNKFNNGQ